MCLLTIMFLLLGWGMIAGPARPLNARLTELWAVHGPAAVASLLLLPGVIFDLLRLEQSFRRPDVSPASIDARPGARQAGGRSAFPPGDFWQEFADDFNTIAARAEEAKT